jgi:TetR/AcrR family transcriptional regulator, cholesterol catabolism regulator
MTKLGLVHGTGDNAAVLLNAAGLLFRKKGFAATTVREIAEAAGVWPGTLHYHFATKESILLALMERGIATAESAFRSAIAASDDPIERIRLAIDAHIRMLVGDDDGTYVLLYEGRGLEGDARTAMVRLRDRYDALWEGLLYQAIGTGRLRPDVSVRMTRLFILGAVNWVAQWFSRDGGRPADEVASHFSDTLLHGLLRPER